MTTKRIEYHRHQYGTCRCGEPAMGRDFYGSQVCAECAKKPPDPKIHIAPPKLEPRSSEPKYGWRTWRGTPYRMESPLDFSKDKKK
jgi:hypothetical protein